MYQEGGIGRGIVGYVNTTLFTFFITGAHKTGVIWLN